jgi:hypothetical protein
VKAMCILHNIIIDLDGVDHNLTPTEETHRRCTGLRGSAGRPTDEGKRVREQFAQYFHCHRVKKIEDEADSSSSDEYEHESECDSPDSVY